MPAGYIGSTDRCRSARGGHPPGFSWSAGLSFVNLAFMGFGADVYGVGTLSTGLVFAALIIPVFIYRHYFRDKGHFPDEMKQDLGQDGDTGVRKRAGIWPFVVLALGVAVVAITHRLAVY